VAAAAGSFSVSGNSPQALMAWAQESGFVTPLLLLILLAHWSGVAERADALFFDGHTGWKRSNTILIDGWRMQRY
jgi:prepilin-type processing-associated H-X9-DG protein